MSSGSSLIAAAALLTSLLCSVEAGPLCQSRVDALNGDENKSCHKYFACDGNGEVKHLECAYGLFWNNETDYCDYPGNVTCEVAEEELEALAPKRETFLYLTFDDGPYVGTTEVLDALKEEDIKASFFINTDKMFSKEMEGWANWTNAEGQANMIREIVEGHTIGDHSYDHMAHNGNRGNKDAYLDPEVDAEYFGPKNFRHVKELMEEAELSEEQQKRVSDTFFRYARMPYTNNWRLIDRFRLNCQISGNPLDCTRPPYSALNSYQTSDILEAKHGTNVIGWDLEWFTDWYNPDHCGHGYGARGMLMRLPTLPTKLKDKIVILTHEHRYSNSSECSRKDLGRLKRFLKWAKQLGYKFRTIDTYVSDNPGGSTAGPSSSATEKKFSLLVLCTTVLFNLVIRVKS